MKDDDFGFSFSSIEEIADKNNNKADEIRRMIMPLLNNLMKNPEKDTIIWPDRVARIKQFIRKMDEIVDG